MENVPNEIVLKILGYLGLVDLIQCVKVSKRFNTICRDKSLSYRSSTLIIKDLTVNDQKFINNFLIAIPEIKEVTIHSISLEGDLESRLSRESVKWTFMGPKRYCMEKKMKVLKSQGASVLVMRGDGRTRNMINKNNKLIPKTKLLAVKTSQLLEYILTYVNDQVRLSNIRIELGLFYYMPT